MKFLIVITTAILFVFWNPFLLNAAKDNIDWQGKDRFGNLLTEKDIKFILIKYLNQFPYLFEKDQRKSSKFVYFGIDLEGANLNGLNLSRLINEICKDMRISTRLMPNIVINLRGANLREANLSSLHFFNSNFSAAEAAQCDLSQAMITNSNFDNAVFSIAKFKKAQIVVCTFNNATFFGADMEGASIDLKSSQRVSLRAVNFKNATLSGNFKNSNLSNANLESAVLYAIDLSFSKLVATNLSGVKMNGKINLSNVQYEAISKPSVDFIEEIQIKDIWFKPGHQAGLIRLKEALKSAGMRPLEREANYYIEKNKTTYSPVFERYFKRLLFEFTCKWGMSPGRPLFILGCLIFVFTIPYAQILSEDIYGKKKSDGIWKVWVPERMRQDMGEDKPEKPLESLNAGFCIKMGFYFSVLSAFHFGWRDLNVGTWIARMHPHEYRLQATGWARVFSGLQSLISVYLLALSVLTYFGRPFES